MRINANLMEAENSNTRLTVVTYEINRHISGIVQTLTII